MCRSKTDPAGELRCNCDSTGKRRLRRKTTQQILEHSYDNLINPPQGVKYEPDENTPAAVDIETLINSSAALKEKFRSAPDKGTDDYDQFHVEMETKITSLGIHIATLIDKDPRIIESEAEYNSVLEKITETEKPVDDLTTVVNRNRRDLIKILIADDGFLGTVQSLDEKDKEKIKQSWDELEDSTKEAYKVFIEHEEQLNMLIKTVQDTRDALRMKQFDSYQKMIDMNEKVTIEYLSKFRQLGGQLKIAGVSDKEQTDGLQTSFLEGRYLKKVLKGSVSKIYPTEWLNASNDTPPPLKVGLTKRASYTTSRISDGLSPHDLEFVSKETKTFTISEDGYGVKNTISNLSAVFNKIDGSDKYDFLVSRGKKEDGRNIFRISVRVPRGETVKYNSAPYPDEIMRKEGWVESVDVDRISPYLSALSKEPVVLDQLINNNKIWVKPENVHHKRTADLSLDRKESKYARVLRLKGNHDSNKAFALHEFGHRAETIIPYLKEQEHAFLKRRTGKDDSTWNYNLLSRVVNDEGNIEYYHDGDFVAPYVGRQYFSDDSYEVFTVGVESVLGGNYGMLKGKSMGAEVNVPDIDHRGFVLGILSTL